LPTDREDIDDSIFRSMRVTTTDFGLDVVLITDPEDHANTPSVA